MRQTRKTATRSQTGQWLVSLLTTLVVLAIFSLYLFARRGYYNLYIANKALGSTAAVVAGITLLIGPLVKTGRFNTGFLLLRRELGLSAFGAAVAHVAVSLFLLPQKFPLAWYLQEWLPIALGVAAIFIWAYLTSISSEQKMKELGGKRWIKHLRWGSWIAFGLIFGHLVIMKYPGWQRWWQGQVKASVELANFQYPPASLIVFVVLLGVLAYRGFFLRNKS